MFKHSLTAAALTVALATPAFAQVSQPNPAAQPSTQSNGAGEKFLQKQQASDWRGSKLIGTTVYGQDNASIGEVNDVLIGDNGAIRAAVIGVGGFLGVGEKNVAVPFDALKITAKPDSSSIQKITVSYTKDQLKAAPTFAYADTASSATTGSGLNSLSGSNGTGRPAAPSGGSMQPAAPASGGTQK
jgi:sporulation protein YlmC with PRC-barrel domain